MRAAGYYPIGLSLQGRPCLVVGGGMVAQHKTKTLMQYGAQVTVVSPALTPLLRRWARARRIHAQQRAFRPDDVRGRWLVYGATDDERVQRAVFRAAQRRNIWVNIVDQPSLCTFIAPAHIKRGNLTIAISTGGRAPSVARHVRRKIERLIGPEYAALLRLMERLRPAVRRAAPTIRQRGRIMERLMNDRVMNALRQGHPRLARRRAEALLRKAGIR